MNKIKIIGLILLIVGVVIHFSSENDGTDFFTGLMIGVGIGLFFTGRIGNEKSE